MDENKKNKFEAIASFLHGEDVDSRPVDFKPDHDFKASEKIFRIRGKVRQIGLLSQVENALGKVDRRIMGKTILPRRKMFKVMRYAAVILVVISLSVLVGTMVYKSASEGEKVVVTQIVSPTGKMKQVDLPDGSIVWLGSNSGLRYDNFFGRKNRTVTLDGEAMFEVMKGKDLAFLVRLGKSAIKVHGTRFLVNDYASASKSEVILLEGKVEYKKDGQSVFIDPGEKLVDNHESDKIEMEKIDIEHYKGWISGKVYFEHEKLSELTFFLEQWYGVRFSFQDDSLEAYSFTGMINKEKPLEYTLKIISLTNKVKFKKDENEITVTN